MQPVKLIALSMETHLTSHMLVAHKVEAPFAEIFLLEVLSHTFKKWSIEMEY